MIRRGTAAMAAALALSACGETEMRTYEAAPERQSWATRAGDEPLGGAALRGTFTGNVITYDDGTVTRFYKDGGFARTSQAETATGTFEITEDGVVCLHPDAGVRDCAIYVERDRTMVRLDQAGGAAEVTAINEI